MDVTAIQAGRCPSLSGSSTLQYQIGIDAKRQPHLRVVGNDGGGFFSDEWIAVKDIRAACQTSSPVTSAALTRLFARKSANSPGFLLGVLVALKLVAALPDKTRHFKLLDAAPFVDRVVKLSKSATPASPKPLKKSTAKKSPPKKKAK